MGWTNSDYSYAYHIAGGCQTPEEAHRVLSECRNARLMAIREFKLAMRKREVDRAKLEREIEECADDLDKEGLRIDLEKLGVHEEAVEKPDYAYAVHEVEMLDALLAHLSPHCNWADGTMTMQEGYQQAQQRERYSLLLERARVGIISQGGIDSETIREMRSHPDALALEAASVAMVAARNEGTLRLAAHKKVPWLLTA